MNVIFINSHPVQYFAPLYRYLNKQHVQTACWYCSDENLKGHLDQQFGVQVAWDIPILDGYPYRFFKNYAPKPSIYSGFFGLVNVGMIKALFKEPKSIVIVHGWAYFTHVMVLIFARIAGHTVCLRGETPLNQELLKSKKVQTIKKLFLGNFLFKWVNKFLYIGAQNKAFYNYHHVQESKLIFAPYTVDNDRFHQAAIELVPLKENLRKELGLPAQNKIILFTAKYIAKKRPLDLLAAYQRLQDKNTCLVMVGEGELRGEMQSFIQQHNLQNVFLTGFVNQGDIGKYYAVADIFVMCSAEGETWGLSVNEALNFNLPIVVSDITGCAADLVKEGENGYIFKGGDIDDLKTKIKKALVMESRGNDDLLKRYSFSTITNSLKNI